MFVNLKNQNPNIKLKCLKGWKIQTLTIRSARYPMLDCRIIEIYRYTKLELRYTKLRISSHKLPVESGRYNNIPFDKRTCKLCNLNEVGNEQHYLMQCGNTLLKEIRYSFIQKLHQINSSFSLFNDQDLFLYIISMKDRSITKLVAKFCYDILAGFDHLQ